MFNKSDKKRNAFMLNGSFADEGYDWWWHSFTGVDDETGEEKTFFIEMFTCNPELGGKEPVLGQKPSEKKVPSYLMVKAGCWGKDHTQLHRFIGWDDVNVKSGSPYYILADDCYADEYELRGSITVDEEENKLHPEWMCDSGSMSWDIKLNKQIAFNVGYGAGAFLRFIKAFEMYWHAEGMKTLYSGTIILNGRHYSVYPGKSYGYADKNWGENFTSPWVWLSSCDLVSLKTNKRLLNSAFDIGGGCPKVFGIPLKKKLLGAFYYEGEEFEFNFSKIFTRTRTKFACKETKNEIWWHVIQENRDSYVDVMAKCPKKEMLLINYEAPDGTKKHNRLWNGGTGTALIKLYDKYKGNLYLVDEIKAGHLGCEYGEFDAID